jgi:hypothetical protein
MATQTRFDLTVAMDFYYLAIAATNSEPLPLNPDGLKL